MTIELTVAISVACALLGAALGVFGHKRNISKDIAEDARSDGVIFTEIGYIKSGVDDIKRKQDRQDDLYAKLSERVVAIEASAKQAHKRLDRLEGSVKPNE